VATSKNVATPYTWRVVEARAETVHARIGAPAGASVSADIAALTGVVSEGVPHSYFPTAATRVVGDDDGGTVDDLAARDDALWQVGEVSGAIGLHAVLDYSSIGADEIPLSVRLSGYYAGSASHYMNVYAYNYVTDAEVLRATMGNRSAEYEYSIPLGEEFVSGAGAAKLIFRHVTGVTMNTSHALRLNCAELVTVEATNQSAQQIAQILSLLTDAVYGLSASKALLQDVDNEVDTIGGTLSALPSNVADAVWDEPLSGHNIAGTAGKRIRQIVPGSIFEGTVVSATGNTVTLDAGASSVNGAYDPSAIYIDSGAGAGQTRNVFQYDGATRTAVVDRDWKTIPNDTSTYVIVADAGREHVNEGLVRAATINTVQLNTSASDDNNAYVGQIVFIRSGTGQDQARRVGAYDGGTKIATLTRDWAHVPDATSAYAMLPTAALSYNCIREAVLWADVATYGQIDGSLGKAILDMPDHVNLTPEDLAAIEAAAQAGGEAATPDVTVNPTTLDSAEREAIALAAWESPERSLTSAGVPDGWVEITGDTLDDSGVALGPVDAVDVLIEAYNEAGVLIALTRTEGDGGFSIHVPPGATYTLSAQSLTATYADRTVTV